MDILIPETNKKPGVCYAVTDEGIEVPVIDVTSPAFRAEIDAKELDAAVKRAMADMQQRAQMPPEKQQRQLQQVLKGSFFASRLAAAQGRVLDGMSTYLLKLGPDNLGGYAKGIDRAIAASLPCLSTRLRLQHMARLSADGLAPILEMRPGRPLHLLNIAGGSGMDSLNTLILICKERPDLLHDRSITIHLLDPDSAGPSFGARAAMALGCEDGPLYGIALEILHEPFDWSRPEQLQELAGTLTARSAVLAGSSEGGLFEYDSDENIIANLQSFHRATGNEVFMVGTATRADGAARVSNSAGGAAIRLRGLEAFAVLARSAGWRVHRVADSPLSHDVLLLKNTPGALVEAPQL